MTPKTSILAVLRNAVACSVIGLSCLAASPSFAGPDDIDTTGAVNTTVYHQGPSESPTYGEVITGPSATDHYLTSFTFYFQNTGTAFDDIAQVYAWNGTTTVGSALYSSGNFSIKNDGSTFDAYNINTSAGGGVNLAPSGLYALVFTTIGADNAANATGLATSLWTPGSAYAAGYFIFNEPGTGYSATYADHDLGFKATFGTGPSVAAVPEPGMIVTGVSMLSMTGLGLVRGRRRSAKKTPAAA